MLAAHEEGFLAQSRKDAKCKPHGPGASHFPADYAHLHWKKLLSACPGVGDQVGTSAPSCRIIPRHVLPVLWF